MEFCAYDVMEIREILRSPFYWAYWNLPFQQSPTQPTLLLPQHPRIELSSGHFSKYYLTDFLVAFTSFNRATIQAIPTSKVVVGGLALLHRIREAPGPNLDQAADNPDRLFETFLSLTTKMLG
jgi:hypothetical protein